MPRHETDGRPECEPWDAIYVESYDEDVTERLEVWSVDPAGIPDDKRGEGEFPRSALDQTIGWMCSGDKYFCRCCHSWFRSWDEVLDHSGLFYDRRR